ncbi:hypothetical protein [uncultured Mucilaginibacter sp.]|uniref:hypothetical protein n=1 Tax=uncultured Mucilaginibacter sp. TaxID=797541 RepID=UPI0025CECDF6|nr:hypothetical protein [uncultured Mucilaginibacter sp.]
MNANQTRNKKLQALHQVLLKLNVIDCKKEIVGQYGVESSRDLTDKQLDELLERLAKGITNRYSTEQGLKAWRSHVIVQLNKYGIYATNNDWTKVNQFMLDKRVAGKLLYELNVDELKALVPKIASMAKKRSEKQRSEIKLAMYN